MISIFPVNASWLTCRGVAFYVSEVQEQKVSFDRFLQAYVADYQENVTVVPVFISCWNRCTTLVKERGTLSALGQTVCAEIIVCTIPLLVQLKGVEEWTEWLALEFLIETT